MVCTTFMAVLVWSSWSSSNFLLMMVIPCSIGTDVQNAETLYEVIHSLGCSIIPLTCCTKPPVFFMWCENFPTKGLRILANSLATS